MNRAEVKAKESSVRDPYDTLGTVSGQFINILNPQPESYKIEDIACGLARVCRWYGQITGPVYSVAQHSVLVSLYCSPSEALAGLLHDGTESILGDKSRPLRRLFPEYVALEQLHMVAIGAAFNVPATMSAHIEEIDSLILLAEYRDLRPRHDAREFPGVDIEHETRNIPTIVPWDTYHAERWFLDRYQYLATKMNAEGQRDD